MNQLYIGVWLSDKKCRSGLYMMYLLDIYSIYIFIYIEYVGKTKTILSRRVNA